MAYTAWSVVAFEQPTAAKWNQLGANDAFFKALIDDAPYVYATLSGNQTLSSGGLEKILFGSEQVDLGGDFASGTYTAPRDQIVDVTSGLRMENWGAATIGSAGIYVNGALLVFVEGRGESSADDSTVVVTASLKLDLGDTVEIYGRHSGSGNVIGLTTSTYLFISEVRPIL